MKPTEISKSNAFPEKYVDDYTPRGEVKFLDPSLHGGQATNWYRTAMNHGMNADVLKRKLNRGLSGSGWGFAETFGNHHDPVYYNEERGYLFDPYGKKSLNELEIPESDYPSVDYDLLDQWREQRLLNELANASDYTGRDLYHDDDYRSGRKKYRH